MDDFTDKVRILAHELWELAGRPEGRNDEFWFAAEAKVLESAAKTEEATAEAPSSEAEAHPSPEAPGSFENAA
jgi:hypothetical protein